MTPGGGDGYADILRRAMGIQMKRLLVFLFSIALSVWWSAGPLFAKDFKRQQPSQGALDTQLLRAIKSFPQKSSLTQIKRLLKRGANSNASFPAEGPLLAFALCSTNINLVNLLLDHGAKLAFETLSIKVCKVAQSQKFMDAVVHAFVAHGASLSKHIPLYPDKLYYQHRYKGPPLFEAVQDKNILLARSLLKAGSNPNEQGDVGWTPLEIAIENRFDLARDTLLEHPKIHIRAETFQHVIERSGTAGLVRRLIRQGGNPNELNYAHETPLLMAAEHGYVEILDLLLREGKVDINQQGERCQTALSNAARYGHMEAVKFLLAQGADINIPCGGEYESSPLEWALYEKHPEIAPILLDAGALVSDRSIGHNKALPLAVSNGYDEIVKRMLAMGAPVDTKQGPERTTALMEAAYRGQLDMVMMLVERGAAMNEFSKPECGGLGCDTWTPFYGTSLMWATRNGHIEVARYLLEHGADPDLANFAHETAYTLALKLNHEKLFQLLLSHAKDIRQGTDQAAHLFYFAAAQGRLDVMDYLLQRGIEVDGLSLLQWTPLIAACLSGQTEAVRFLIERGANVNMSLGGNTPLLAALGYPRGSHARAANAEIVELLIQAGAEVNRPYLLRLTALSEAVQSNQKEVVHLLLGVGADPNVPGDILDPTITVLQAAAQWGRIDILKALIKAGADVTKDGHRAIQLAKVNSHDDAARLLEHELAIRR